MNTFAKLRGEKRHECRAFVIGVANHHARRATRQLAGVGLGLLQQALTRHSAVGLSRVIDCIVFLKALHEPLRRAVVLPPT